MRVLISGSTGLIGSALFDDLAAAGHKPGRLVRQASQGGAAEEGDVAWSPADGHVDRSALAGFDAVVHLAGESIAGGRWTRAKKDRILDSRVKGTALLAGALAELASADRPAVLVSASAVGYYGDQGDRELAENAPGGKMFLSEVCRQWESAAAPAAEAGIRVVHPRLGVVLSRRAGALAAMLRPFRMGLGGPVGAGRQYISWIALADAVAAIRFLIDQASLAGPVNICSPEAVTNAEFARALGRAMHRPAIVPTPAFAVRLALGEMADELVLASARMMPKKLLDAGFAYRYPLLPDALTAALE